MNLGAFLEHLGLGAALVGVLCGMRGWWPAAVGCVALVLVCTVLAAVWEPPRPEVPSRRCRNPRD